MPVSRDELVRYRRLLELARAQRDAVAEGRLGDLPRILAERHVVLAGIEAGEGAVDGALAEEAREILRAVLDVDAECRRLVLERLHAVQEDLGTTRTALEGSRAYRHCLEAGGGARVLDERK